MKTRIHYFGAMLLTLAMLCGLSGCASFNNNGVIPLKQTRDNADWAMVAFHNRVTYGFVTPNEEQRVVAAYKAYQTAFNEAAKAANYNYKTPTPPNVAALANQLADALASIP